MKALAFPFRVGVDGHIAATTFYEQVVRGQVIDALMTNLGERKMRPRYGCDVQAAVFDPTDLLERSDAAAVLRGRLSTLVPRTLIRNVTLQPEGLGGMIITITYRATPYAEDTNLAVPVASEYLTRQSLATQAARGAM